MVTAPDHLHFSIWAEDGYLVASDSGDGRTSFVEPSSCTSKAATYIHGRWGGVD